MNASSSDIQVGTLAERVFIKIDGKGTHANCQSLREFVFGMIEQGYRDFRLDLRHCTYMDSTFLGMLVGVSLRLKEVDSSRIHILHINERNLELLQTLGIEHFFRLDSDAAAGAEQPDRLQLLPEGSQSKLERAETMLDAHETLARVDENNLPRFKDCIEFLKEDLARMKAGSDPSSSRPDRSEN